ncbi:GntR family transcriptional regulator [Bacillus fonticola]|uniref:GntR family transcriptional regulator n=1 Tax=Bacillus fonticola TaxID=2728853 RepID=UPI0014727C42|nr:GntR family transcriptional regulator [Bacillus fonticola]
MNPNVPRYVAIADTLKEQIYAGIYKPGQLIPPERKLCDQFGVSRMTLRHAVEQLVIEGLLLRRRGSGTYVQEQKLEQPLYGLTSFTEDIRSRGMTPSSRLLQFEIIPAHEEVSDVLLMKENTPVYYVSRIRYADEFPMAIEYTYLPANEVKGLTEEKLAQHSLYSFLQTECGLLLAEADQAIDAGLATQEEAEALQIEEGAPVLIINRITRTVHGDPIEWSKSIYRGDKYTFTISIRQS